MDGIKGIFLNILSTWHLEPMGIALNASYILTFSIWATFFSVVGRVQYIHTNNAAMQDDILLASYYKISTYKCYRPVFLEQY